METEAAWLKEKKKKDKKRKKENKESGTEVYKRGGGEGAEARGAEAAQDKLRLSKANEQRLDEQGKEKNNNNNTQTN